MFEVKLSGGRGETVKRRIRYPVEDRAELTEQGVAHLADSLHEAYHQGVPVGMRPTMVTTFRRTTFVARTGEFRLTCDTELVCRDAHDEVHDSGSHVLVESKSGSQSGSAALLIGASGVSA